MDQAPGLHTKYLPLKFLLIRGMDLGLVQKPSKCYSNQMSKLNNTAMEQIEFISPEGPVRAAQRPAEYSCPRRTT